MLYLLGIFSIAILLYTYIGYPLLLMVLARLKEERRPLEKKEVLPSVSVILSVYNEEEVIADKIRNFLDLNYPEDKAEMIIVSDGSTDRTVELARSVATARIKILDLKERKGKTEALNRAVKEASGDILVFTDANSMFKKDALKRLAKPFVDPAVGLVSGQAIYVRKGNREELRGLYLRYEEALKKLESMVASLVGADGAIYAMRRSLYSPIQAELINDFLHPIQIVLKGFKALFEPQAIALEEAEEVDSKEFWRQKRITAQAMRVYLHCLPDLVVRGKWLYIWQLTSHKFLRWLTFAWMALLFLITPLLYRESIIFHIILWLEAFFVLLVIIGLPIKYGLWRFPSRFMLLQIAFMAGVVDFLRGKRYVTWEPRKG